MTGRPRLSLLAALVLALGAGVLPLTEATGAERPDPGAEARHRLMADASGGVRIVAARSGRVGFVGTTAASGIDNPAVTRGSSVAQAARAHLDRYGALLGATGDTAYVQRSARHSVSGTDVVTYAQEVDGVPVVGGDVVVSIGPDRALRSIQSTISGIGTVPAATVAEEAAEVTAVRAVERGTHARGLHATTDGRWLLDPKVVDVSLPTGARTVWRFEVGDGGAVRQLVLVDDRTGQVVLHSDLVEHADPDRVVCDRNEAPGDETPCTSGFARQEGDPPVAGNPDVNDAYELSGAVSAFYRRVAGVNLTDLLGIDVGGVKKLASTVRFCDPTAPCPYSNAFWNGQQMFYGTGWAHADDIVGHEMTHGFIDQYSRLFYWGQSGAINESMADVIGEIIDHQNPSPGDTSDSWDLGEDSPIGPIRSLSDPTASYQGLPGQPDRMTSELYTADDVDYGDNGGVHTDSGVGNKTAYLISQGGTFNGRTIAGIDAGDPTLGKTAQLYVDVIERLSSGADYAALAQQLDQSCQDLRSSAGFSAADCAAVHQATDATELSTTPTNAAQPADAPTTCPADTTKRILLDSETGDSAGKFDGTPGWTRTAEAGTSNATSGTASWHGDDLGWTATRRLRARDPIYLPDGQSSYLSFNGWYLFDYWGQNYYDGGTVELETFDPSTSVSTASLPWVNGPTRVLRSGGSGGGQPAFAGDSHGWVGSRLDLTSYAGRVVVPEFTTRSDYTDGSIGWYLDDITVYTCDPVPPSAVQRVTVDGVISGMNVRWAPPAAGARNVTGYRVYVSPCLHTQTLPATATSTSLVVSSQQCGGTLVVTVVPTSRAQQGAPPVAVTVQLGMARLRARRVGSHVLFKGVVSTVAGSRVVGGSVRISRRTPTGWVTVRTVTTGSNGAYSAMITRRKRAVYRVAYLGGPFLIGSHHKDLRL